ncbi:MAG: FAD-dependent oxidoreductase, partial [Clostridiales bacterium]|nr:FAD-dependent oxidoreductase [Clostridiales bacterium]
RQGCKSVVQLEMTPRPPEQRAENNPWPQWPKVLKTDYGQREAAAVFGSDPRVFETTVKELVVTDGKLTAIKTVKVRFGDHGPEQVEGTEKEIECDMLITAAGFVGCEDYIAKASGVSLTRRGTVDTAENGYSTSVEGVFSAGDMRRGQSLVVWAIAEGRHCAAEVDGYLMGYTTLT